MASRKDDKERLRAERLEAEKREHEAARRRLMFGYVAAGILGLAVVAGIVVAVAGGGGGGSDSSDSPANAHIVAAGGKTFGVPADGREGTAPPAIEQGDLAAAARAAGCTLRLDLPDEGNAHVDDPTVKYGTNPPTSGDHNVIPQSDGAYSEMPEPVHLVHSLEHGRVEFQYSPDLSEEDQLAIKGVFDADPGGLLVFPNDQMPYEVAATAWTNLVGCKQYDGPATLDVLQDFRDQFRGRGPEPADF